MQYIATQKEMQAIDRYTTEEIGIESLVLMERAALAVVQLVESVNSTKERVLVVVERGNNGGDGLAVARILKERGFGVDIFLIGAIKKSSPSFDVQASILKKIGVIFKEQIPEEKYAVIIDAIFGVGLSREIVSLHKKVIESLNRMSAIKIAVDIPSGIDATTGNILGIAVRADYTVTFGLKKRGMFFQDGIDYCGEVILADIGFPKVAIQHSIPMIYTYDEWDIPQKLPKRFTNSNKGTYGRVAVIAGSENMSGAAYLCAKAAYSVGSGLVKIYTHERNRTILQTQLPEAVMMTYSDLGTAINCVEDAMQWATAIVVGPGIGTEMLAEQMVYRLLLDSKVPLVVDADALNVLSGNMDLVQMSAAPMILTPHMKEMSRLTGMMISEIIERRFEVAMEFAKRFDIVLVLKDARTIVSDGGEQIYMNQTGNDGMSTGGAGDVLAGIVGGLLAGGLELKEAAMLATCLHGLAGDKAAQKKGKYAMLASDIITHLETVMRDT